MFLKIGETEKGPQTWYSWGLKLLYPDDFSLVPSVSSAWEAKQAFDIVLAYWPNRSEVYYHRGVAFATLTEGRWISPLTGRALQDFAQALSLNPYYAEVYQARATLFTTHDSQRAIADLSALLEFQPSVEVYLQRAELLLALGKYQAAIADYQEALKRYINYCGVQEAKVCEGYLDRIELELRLGNVQAVLSSLSQFWQQHRVFQS